MEQQNSLTTKSNEIPVVYISPETRLLPNWREIWLSRELLYFLTWREIKVRYKQTVFGIGWAVIQPFVTMVVFSIFFGNVVKVPSYEIPYPIFSFTALVPWSLFSSALILNSQSVVANANLIRKVYFPNILFPLSATASRLVDFVVSFLILLGMMVIYDYFPTLKSVVLIPAFTLLATIAALGVGFWLSALNVRYRDIRQIIPFIIQVWLFATPVVFPSNLLGKTEQILYGINPMTSVVEGFRWALLGIEPPPPAMFVISIVTTVVVFFSGVFFFEHQQSTFADVI